jgi:hypothetical protein
METNLKQFVENLLRDAIDHGDLIHESLFHSGYNSEPSEWDSDEEKEFRAALTEAGVVCRHEDNYGGEGQGDDYWSVYSFTRGDEKVYVKFDGWYASYNGAEFNEWFFVEPKEKVITVFDRVKDW